jgi:hypothetical protein
MEKTMGAKTLLTLGSAFILLSPGIAHLVYTFWGPKLLPRDPSLIDSMKGVSLVITSETTVWKSWIGFNASHSMAAILFGFVYGYLAAVQPGVLYESSFLQAVGFLTLFGFVFLVWIYWFSVPLIGVSLALLCYVASILLAHA